MAATNMQQPSTEMAESSQTSRWKLGQSWDERWRFSLIGSCCAYSLYAMYSGHLIRLAMALTSLVLVLFSLEGRRSSLPEGQDVIQATSVFSAPPIRRTWRKLSYQEIVASQANNPQFVLKDPLGHSVKSAISTDAHCHARRSTRASLSGPDVTSNSTSAPAAEAPTSERFQ